MTTDDAPEASSPLRSEEEPDLITRPYEPDDEVAVVPMYEAVFGRARTADEVTRRLTLGPGGPARRHVLLKGEQVIGHTALLPMPAWVDGERRLVSIGLDSMVLPRWQGGGRFALLAESLLSTEDAGDVVLAFTADRPLRTFERLARNRSQERLVQWVRWHDVDHLERSAGRSFPKPWRPAIDRSLRLLTLAARLPSSGVRVEAQVPSDAELDELSRQSASFASRINIRDSTYLRWRWFAEDGAWSLRSARNDAGALLGWVVLGIDPRRADGTGVIGDVLATSPRALTALVRHAADALRDQGAGVVTFAYRDPRPWSTAAVAAAGFARRGVAPPILTSALTPRGHDLLDISGWYFTTGEIV
jgi:hypothetical protein